MLKHLVPMMKKMARPLLARRGAAQYPEHDLALAATFLWVIERHSGILLFVCPGAAVYQEVSGRKLLQSGGPSGRFNEMCRTTASRLAQ